VGGDNQPDPEEVAERSRFDQVNVKGQHYDGRYSMLYEMLVSRKGTQRALSLRILDYPQSTGDIHPFEKDTGTVLGEWAAVSDHPNVVRVLDWGSTPRLWVATAFIETTLLAREHLGFVTGLEMALSLTEAVSYLHQHDVVHGAIDPQNVVFPGESFPEGPVDQLPLLDNVGLIRAYDGYVGFEELLSPQFTAPEYYSDQFGRLDHMTDIYQLGATCYYLFTGEFPYIGTAGEIRESVLEEEPPIPSATRDDVPPAIDNIISKAMATEKIRRYETVEQFRQELDSVADEYRETTS
jgi:serine/threonine protein kinase